jgi:hypothetical protein
VQLPVTPGLFSDFTGDPSDPNTLYLCAASNVVNALNPQSARYTVSVTHDAGVSWRQLLTAQGTFCSIAVASDDSQRLLVTIWRDDPNVITHACLTNEYNISNDAGQTWRRLTLPADQANPDTQLNCFVYIFAQRIYVQAEFVTQESNGLDVKNRLLSSDDNGISWQSADYGITLSNFIVSFGSNPANLYAVVYRETGQEIWNSVNGGHTWRRSTNSLSVNRAIQSNVLGR